ncbi:hypothetical protein RUND412_002920 [Rhizina undulata]
MESVTITKTTTTTVKAAPPAAQAPEPPKIEWRIVNGQLMGFRQGVAPAPAPASAPALPALPVGTGVRVTAEVARQMGYVPPVRYVQPLYLPPAASAAAPAPAPAANQVLRLGADGRYELFNQAAQGAVAPPPGYVFLCTSHSSTMRLATTTEREGRK